VVLADAVVNTGATVVPVLQQLLARRPGQLIVVSLVGQQEAAERLSLDFPDVHFLFARLSSNRYVGVGGTDTGNRLFGTFMKHQPQAAASLSSGAPDAGEQGLA